MIKLNKLAVWLALFFVSTNGFAAIVLPSIFSDNMVLQQNSEVAIWGWSNPSEKFKMVASWNPKDTILVEAKNSSFWSTKLKTIGAGGPYTLTFLGSSKIELKNVMLGEVWLCSGQSNMEWSVNAGVMNGEEEAAQANFPNIRIINIPRIAAPHPQQDTKAYPWAACTPQTMRHTSAVGYMFAKELQKNLNVPIGIIVSAWGGSIGEAWFRKELFEADPILKAHYFDEKAPWAPAVPGSIYNGMIAALMPFNIAGALWYQGESNVSKPQAYSQLLRTLVESWRQDFGKPFPFYYVQIAPYDYGGGKSYVLREQQAKALSIPNTGMVVISDLVDNVKDIHPRLKFEVGKRLANMALAETYGKQLGVYKSPMYKSMKVEKNKIRISFDNAPNGLKSTGKTITHFQIAGEDKKFVEATATISGNTVVVSSKSVKNPVAVRYCFENMAMPNLFNKEGLPVAQFRTDNWDVE